MTVKKYIRKEILDPPVEAMQWTGENMIDITSFVNTSKNYEALFVIKNNKWGLKIRDCSCSIIEYNRNDYVIKASENFYPMCEESFNDLYKEDEWEKHP